MNPRNGGGLSKESKQGGIIRKPGPFRPGARVAGKAGGNTCRINAL